MLDSRQITQMLPKPLHIISPSLRFRSELVEWRPGVNDPWDLTAFIDTAGIPDAAEAMIMGWTATRISPTMNFDLQDRTGLVVVSGFRYSAQTAFTDTLRGPIHGSPNFHIGSTRRLSFTTVGGTFADTTPVERTFVVWAWF